MSFMVCAWRVRTNTHRTKWLPSESGTTREGAPQAILLEWCKPVQPGGVAATSSEEAPAPTPTGVGSAGEPPTEPSK